MYLGLHQWIDFGEIFGLSWGRPCGGIIGALSKTTSNISTMRLGSLSGLEFSIILGASTKYKTCPSTYLHLQWRVGCTKRKIGLYEENNLTKMLSELTLITESLHPCRMSCKINMRNIVPYPNKNGVKSCSTYNLNMIEKGCVPYQDDFNL